MEKKKGVSGVIAKCVSLVSSIASLLLFSHLRMLSKIQGRPLVSYHVKSIRMQCAGTPHYMAPEMIRGQYDEKCDMFSAGVILHQVKMSLTVL